MWQHNTEYTNELVNLSDDSYSVCGRFHETSICKRPKRSNGMQCVWRRYWWLRNSVRHSIIILSSSSACEMMTNRLTISHASRTFHKRSIFTTACLRHKCLTVSLTETANERFWGVDCSPRHAGLSNNRETLVVSLNNRVWRLHTISNSWN